MTAAYANEMRKTVIFKTIDFNGDVTDDVRCTNGLKENTEIIILHPATNTSFNVILYG